MTDQNYDIFGTVITEGPDKIPEVPKSKLERALLRAVTRTSRKSSNGRT
jgi:hypothetical protein